MGVTDDGEGRAMEMPCSQCHTELPEGAQFCPACGSSATAPAPLPPAAVPDASAPPGGPAAVGAGAQPRRSVAPVAMTLIVLVALVGGGIAVITSRDSGGDTTSGGRAGGSSPETVPAADTPETSTTTTNSTTTSTSTTSTTTTLPPDPNAIALTDLAATIDADQAAVDSHLGRWVPQLSAKRDSVRWEGVDYGYPQILELHRELDRRYGALLVSGADYNFRLDDNPMTGWFITIVDQSSTTAEGALDWCRQNGIDRDNCAAKLITNDQDAERTLVLQ